MAKKPQNTPKPPVADTAPPAPAEPSVPVTAVDLDVGPADSALPEVAAAAEPAPAAEVTATESEPEAPTAAAPASEEVTDQDEDAGTAAAEAAEASADDAGPAEESEPTFIQHLQSEIKRAEAEGKNDLHSWLVSLESHLGGLAAHCKRLEQDVSEEIQVLVEDVKSLF